jgi:hypothetical protein
MSILININRKTFLKLCSYENNETDENKNVIKIRKEYIYSTVENSLLPFEYELKLDSYDIEYISNGIYSIILNNEQFHRKYGKIQENGLKQVDDGDMIPSGEEPSGYHYSTGSIVICPFDWSWNNNGDFNYSFQIAKLI